LTDADLHELAERFPVVLFNRRVEGLASLVTDSADGSRQVVEHLVALGHRSIAYLAGPSASWSDGERWRALSASAQDAGVAMVRCGPFPATLDGGPAAADIGLATGATALVAFNDLLAIGVLRRLVERGVAVPGRVSVVGFDDIFGADFCHPPLTTVAGPVDEAGRTLVDVLLADRTAVPAMTLPTHLRVRESTGPPSSPGSGA
jgi:DNA-binding LacI/PurR family transcriptional regulator